MLLLTLMQSICDLLEVRDSKKFRRGPWADGRRTPSAPDWPAA